MSSRTRTLARDRRRRVGLAVLLLLGSDTFAVTKGPTEDSLWYYEIGGAEPVVSAGEPFGHVGNARRFCPTGDGL